MESPPAPPSRPPLDWRPVFLEALFVVMGVVLALAANEWRQHVADERRAEVALTAISEEVRENREAVARSLAYHLALSDSLFAFAQRTNGADAPAPNRYFSQGFVSPASVFATGWEAARTADALGHMPYETVVTLSRMYEQQHEYVFQTQEIGRLIYTDLFNDGYSAMLRKHANILTIVGTLWYRECSLLARYDETLAALWDTERQPRPRACAHVNGR